MVVRLADALDVGRGDMLATAPLPAVIERPVATVCWLSEQPLRIDDRYVLRHTTREAGARVAAVNGRLDIATLRTAPANALALNDIGRVRLELDAPVVVDPYPVLRTTGSFLLVDPRSGATAGAGIVEGATP